MEQTQAASSPAEVDVFNGRDNVSLDEYLRSRENPAEPADTAPADPQPQGEAVDEDQSDIAPDTDTGKDNQEQPPKTVKKHRTANDRMAELAAAAEQEWEKPEPDLDKIARFNATIGKIEAGLKRKTEPAPVVQPQSQPQQPVQAANYDTWEKQFIEEGHGDAWLEGWHKDHPGKSFESGQLAVKAHMRAVERQFERQEQAQRQLQQEIDQKTAQARERYENFDEVAETGASAILADQSIAPLVKQRIAKSKIYADLAFTIGGDSETLSKLRGDAFEALDYIANIESLIREQLAKPRDDKGKFVAKEAPEPKKTAAPKPPSPVGGASTRSFDVNDESLSADEWFRKRNRQVAEKRG